MPNNNKTQLQEIEKKIKKNNAISLFKWIFGKIHKEVFVLEIWTKKQKLELILPEKIANDPAKKQVYLKKNWIDFTNLRKISLSSNYYKNLYDFIFKKNLDLDTVIHILKSIGHTYELGMSSIRDIYLNISDTLKEELSRDLIGTLSQYNFKYKDEIIWKLKTLQNRELEEKWKWYLNIVMELEEKRKMKQHIKKQLVMPAISFLLTIGIFVVANMSLFPIFLQSFWQWNKELSEKITWNIIYTSYHFAINNYIALIILWIWLLISIFILKQLYIVRFYFTKILLYVPWLTNVIKYKELLNLSNNLINKFKYNINNKEFYINLQQTGSAYYASFYTADAILDIHTMLKKMIQLKLFPAEEGSFLLSLISNSQWYENIDNIYKLHKEISIKYQEAVDKYLGYIQSVLFTITALLVFVVVKTLYLSMYDMMWSIKN